jgi:lipoprotein-anchoring transpeptidase ErfK/SrfK
VIALPRRRDSRRSLGCSALFLTATALVAVATGCAQPTGRFMPAPAAAPALAPSPAEPTPSPVESLPAAPPPADLPVVDYGPAPAGFPADPEPLSTARLGEGLQPTGRIGAYDGPGGRPLAYLAPTISGVPITMPIVQRRAGWVAVLLPSANRTVAWVPPGGWDTVPLRDQLIVYRKTHQLDWLRDGAVVRSWPVTLGSPATPTPLGRTFILGRSKLPGAVYAGTDVFALGAVPDNPNAVPTGLRGAHIGVHTWHNDLTIGKDVSDGCIRLTKSGQQQLLAELAPGTEVLVLDQP